MNTTLPLRRRGQAERRVLRLIRGEQGLENTPASGARPPRRVLPSIRPTQLAHFAHLRALAAESGLQIQPPSTPYVGTDELRLLGWIAECQRVVGREVAFRSDHPLVLAIAYCAGALDASGMRLPPMTLYAAKLQQGVGQPVPGDITSEVRSTATGMTCGTVEME